MTSSPSPSLRGPAPAPVTVSRDSTLAPVNVVLLRDNGTAYQLQARGNCDVTPDQDAVLRAASVISEHLAYAKRHPGAPLIAEVYTYALGGKGTLDKRTATAHGDHQTRVATDWAWQAAREVAKLGDTDGRGVDRGEPRNFDEIAGYGWVNTLVETLATHRLDAFVERITPAKKEVQA